MLLKIFSLALLAVASVQCHFDANVARLVLQVAADNGYLDSGYESDLLRHRPKDIEREVEERPFSMNPPVVDTAQGVATGTTWPEAHAFYQIPYAQAPMGELRFQPPLPLGPAQNQINATTNLYLRCFQFEADCAVESQDCPDNLNEDCLVLNIFAPSYIDLSDTSQPPTNLLPVMFYIHGGSFNAGGGTSRVLDGRWLSNVTNTVIVTINYRLGPFGFLVLGEGEDAFKGNQGLKDQQLALQWVQDNIGSFGGDKTEVTLFGNSAGSQSVMFHVVSDVSKPLFTRAIQQSNPAVFYYQTPEESLRITSRLTRGLGCTEGEERECLMSASATAISNQQVKVMLLSLLEESDIMGLVEPYRPVVDGIEYTDQPLALFRDGKWNTEKELIVGVNTQELETMQFYYPPFLPFNETLFRIANTVIFGTADGARVTNRYKRDYPPGEGEDFRVTFGIEMSHFFFDCPSRALARYAAESTTAPEKNVYFYTNEQPLLNSICVSQNGGNTSGCYIAEHAAEVVYVFRSGGKTEPDDLAVENQFSTYWGSFARTGDPSEGLEVPVGNFSSWPFYTSDSTYKNSQMGPLGVKYDGGLLGLSHILPFALLNNLEKVSEPWSNIRIKAPASEVETGYKEAICDFWDDLEYYVDRYPLNPTEPPTTRPITTLTPTKTTTLPTTTEEIVAIETTTDSAPTAGSHFMLVVLCFIINALFNPA